MGGVRERNYRDIIFFLPTNLNQFKIENRKTKKTTEKQSKAKKERPVTFVLKREREGEKKKTMKVTIHYFLLPSNFWTGSRTRILSRLMVLSFSVFFLTFAFFFFFWPNNRGKTIMNFLYFSFYQKYIKD